jgi:serine/threonine protein kinase
MSQLRDRWEGASLPGDYLLQRWLSGDEAAAFFETSIAPDGRRAVVKLVPESAVDGDAQLALWQRTRALRHPNLLQLLDCGRAELADELVVYAVFEFADDTLASALAHAPLTEAEAREVLAAAVAALSYLQAQCLALPALDPDQVLAVGDTIKLSTERLRVASPDTPYTAELRALSDRISPSTPAWSADILPQALSADSPTSPPPAHAEIAPVADATVLPSPPAPMPSARRPFPKWPLLAASAVVLLILALNRRPAPETPSQPAAVPEAPAQPTAPIASALIAPPPADPKPSPAGEAVATPPSEPPPSDPAPPATAMWRVIAFTYKAYDDAAVMADQINQRHPDFQAAVFSPPEKKGYFLVSLGGRMTREDAVGLQGRVRAESLSRDVYIKKFLD